MRAFTGSHQATHPWRRVGSQAVLKIIKKVVGGLRRDGMTYRVRMARYGAVSTALSLRSDDQLGQLVHGAPAVGAGIGGTSALLDVDGSRVFVKRIPLTDLERQPGHVRSTANLFALPTFFHYGVGSPGFSAAHRPTRPHRHHRQPLRTGRGRDE